MKMEAVVMKTPCTYNTIPLASSCYLPISANTKLMLFLTEIMEVV